MSTINGTLWEEVVDAPTLTGFARAVLDEYDSGQTLGDLFPNETTDDIEYRFRNQKILRRPAAEYRSYDAASPLSTGQITGSATIGELPPISVKDRLREYDRLRVRNASDAAIQQSVLNPTAALVTQIADRVEMARGEALEDGQIAIDENGISQAVVDFGRASALEDTVGTLWTAGTGDPHNDLMDFLSTYIDEGNTEAGTMIMSTRIWQTLLQSDALRTYVLGATAASNVNTLLRSQVEPILADLGLPPIRIYDRKVDVMDDDGVITRQRVMSDNKIFFTPGTAVGRSLYGITADALELDGLTGNQEGIVASGMSTWDPVQKWTKASAIALPIFGDGQIDATAVLTVMAA